MHVDEETGILTIRTATINVGAHLVLSLLEASFGLMASSAVVVKMRELLWEKIMGFLASIIIIMSDLVALKINLKQH